MRREFIIQGTLTTAALLGFRFSWASRFQNYFVFGFQENGSAYFARYDLKSGKFKKLKVNPARKLHEIFIHKNQKNILFCADKNGKSLLVVDLEKMKLVTRHTLAEGMRFYGHGVFDLEGRHLWLTAYGNGYKGFLIKFDTFSRKFVREIPLLGYYPHQIHRLSDDSLVVGQINDMSKFRSQLCRVDPFKNKITLKHVFSEHKIGTVDHFTVVEGDLIVAPLTKEVQTTTGKEYKPAPIYQWKVGEQKGDFVKLPPTKKSESLTDTVLPFRDRYVLVTNSHRKDLFLYDYKKRYFADILSVEHSPLGISLSGDNIFVNTDNLDLKRIVCEDGKLMVSDTKMLAKKNEKMNYIFEAHAFLM